MINKGRYGGGFKAASLGKVKLPKAKKPSMGPRMPVARPGMPKAGMSMNPVSVSPTRLGRSIGGIKR